MVSLLGLTLVLEGPATIRQQGARCSLDRELRYPFCAIEDNHKE
jgi:hypothetical protein